MVFSANFSIPEPEIIGGTAAKDNSENERFRWCALEIEGHHKDQPCFQLLRINMGLPWYLHKGFMYYFNIQLLRSGTLKVNLALPWLLKGEKSKRRSRKKKKKKKAYLYIIFQNLFLNLLIISENSPTVPRAWLQTIKTVLVQITALKCCFEIFSARSTANF